MIRYSVQSRDRIFVKGFGFLSFTKNYKQNLSSKRNSKLLDHANQSAIDALKTASKRAIQKTAEVTGDLIGNKIANRITKVLKTSQQINSETITNENDQQILELFIIDGLRLI